METDLEFETRIDRLVTLKYPAMKADGEYSTV